jgi:hypothetical protein
MTIRGVEYSADFELGNDRLSARANHIERLVGRRLTVLEYSGECVRQFCLEKKEKLGMFVKLWEIKHRLCLSLIIALLGWLAGAGMKSANANASGNFLAIMNEQTNFGDARKSVLFFDSDAIDEGPLFSVFVPDELLGNREDPDAITVDPKTGDVYVIATDSGTPGNDVSSNGYFDAEGDWDIYRINFADIFAHWSANFEGTDARSLGGALALGGLAPRTTSETSAEELMDYITYGIMTPIQSFIPPPTTTPNAGNWGHSNTFILPDSIEKVGEVNRNPFYSGTLRARADSTIISHDLLFHVIDENTLIAMDDAIDDDVANDHDYRIIRRIDTMPGMAMSDGTDGGYNLGTTESWESHRIGKVNLDTDMGTPVNTSDIQAMAYYRDPSSGVQGVWVGERDGGGDDIAFFQINSDGSAVGYRPFAINGSPSAFALDNDPFNGNDNMGHIDQIFIDYDTGDVIFVEAGFVDDPQHEPGVFRLEIVDYDNNGEIELGAWSEKIILNPVKDPASEEGMFLERGYLSAYDSVNDRVIFAAPGDATDTPTDFAADVYVLNLSDGTTESFLDVDDSISLFIGGFNADYGHKLVAFTLTPSVAGDYNGNGVVDAADYTFWRDRLGQNITLPNADPNDVDNMVTQDEYTFWKSRFGATSGAGSLARVAVPEPALVPLLLSMLSAAAFGKRGRALLRRS